ncbi:MAG: hypothetical protein Kow00129_01510 [Thermoleophilia bacterium]
MLTGAIIGYLAVQDDDGPYVTPICLAAAEGHLYFHTGEGRRSRALAQDPRVCVAVTRDIRLQPSNEPCNVGYDFRSALVFGRAVLLETSSERTQALDHLVASHHAAATGEYDPDVLEQTLIYRIEVESITQKQRPRTV